MKDLLQLQICKSIRTLNKGIMGLRGEEDSEVN